MIDHLSYSAVNTYTECGEKYRLSRVVKVPQQPGYALLGGRAVHTATENRDRLTYGLPIVMGSETFGECFEEEIANAVAETGVPEAEFKVSGRPTVKWPDKENKAWWLYHGPGFVNNYVNWRNRYAGNIWLSPDGYAIEIKIEANFGSEQGQHGAAKVIGFIDRILEEPDGTLRVVDIKAGRTTPTARSQLATYAWGVPESWPRITRGSYFAARKGVLIGDYDLTQDKDLLDQQYGGAWQAIANDYFPVRESYQCNYCPVKDYCYAKDGEFSEAVRPF